MSDYLKRIISILISLICLLFRVLLIKVVGWIGFSTTTTEIKVITYAVFAVQVFASAFLVPLTSANWFMFTGNYSDFNSAWFKDVGGIITLSFSLNCLFPIINLLLTAGIVSFKKMVDQRRIYFSHSPGFGESNT